MKTFTLLICLFFSSVLQAGEAYLTFKVLDQEGKKLKKATMLVYENNTMVHERTIRSSKAHLIIENGHYYTIEIQLDSHMSKRIIVDLRNDVLESDFDDYIFYVELEHVDRYEGVEGSENFLDYPVAILEPRSGIRELTYNRAYMISSMEHKKQLLFPTDEMAYNEQNTSN